MRKINKIIIHASDTYPDMDIGVEEIRRWHVEGNGWKDIGYHFVLRRDGTVEEGRDINISGAHVSGHNHDSIGICLVGGKPAILGGPLFNFTAAQMFYLRDLVHHLKEIYPYAEVKGHNNYTTSKTCPNFDVPAWWSSDE